MLFSLGQMGQWVFDRFVIASGRSGLFLFTLSAASVTNLILDPIFIFGLFGVPRLETLGAAIATVIGQTAGMFAGIVINRKWNREIPFGFTLRPDRKSVADILKVGFPSTLVQILTSFVGIPALRILAFAWLVAIPALEISAGLQGLSMGMSSMILTMARQAVLPLIFAAIFSRWGNLNLLWIGFILAEFIGIPVGMWFWRKGYRRMERGKLQ